MPTKRWIAAGADARDRTMRGWFRDRATECLDATAWYRSSIAGLFAAGNTASTVMGRAYPGAGATLAPAMVGGFLAAEALAAERDAPPR